MGIVKESGIIKYHSTNPASKFMSLAFHFISFISHSINLIQMWK